LHFVGSTYRHSRQPVQSNPGQALPVQSTAILFQHYAARLCQRRSTKAFPEQKTPPTKPPSTKVAALHHMKYLVLQQNRTSTMSLKAMFVATSASPAASQKRKKAGTTFPWMFVSGPRPGGARIVRQAAITGRNSHYRQTVELARLCQRIDQEI